jgi:hypothetical protein
VSYEPIVRNVYIVPVNGAVTPAYAPAIKALLDKVYAPAMVSWNVTVKANLQVDNVSADSFATAGLSEASRYTPDMNAVIKAWRKANNLPNKTVVLFFVKAPNSDKLGYMPLTGNYGFIFNLGSNLELLAHELAHGTFHLKHTFSDNAFWRLNGSAPRFAEGTTQNLMDYTNGTELWKYQWDLIHNPERIVLGALDESEGAAYLASKLYPWYDKEPQTIIDPRVSIYCNYNSGTYSYNKLEVDIEQYVTYKYAHLDITSSENQTLLTTRYFTWLSMYAEFMYKQGLEDIKELNSSSRQKLKTEFFNYWGKTEDDQVSNTNVYLKIRNKRWEQEKMDFLARLAAEDALKELKQIYEEGYTAVAVDLVFATGGTVISTIALLVPEPTTSTKIGAYIGYGIALEKYIGALRKYDALKKGIFDENKEYKVVGGLVQENLGEAGYLI